MSERHICKLFPVVALALGLVSSPMSAEEARPSAKPLPASLVELAPAFRAADRKAALEGMDKLEVKTEADALILAKWTEIIVEDYNEDSELTLSAINKALERLRAAEITERKDLLEQHTLSLKELKIAALQELDRDQEALDLSIEMLSQVSSVQRTASRIKAHRLRIRLKGKPAESFAATHTIGEFPSFESLKGTVTLLAFFSPGSRASIREIPTLEKIRLANRDQIALALVTVFDPVKKDEEELNQVQQFASKHLVSWPIVIAPRRVVQDYSVDVVPHLVLIDKKGSIRAFWTSYFIDSNKVQKAIDKLQKES